MNVIIPDVPLIPQDQTMACWYASAQMVIRWRRGRTRMTEIAHPDPSEVPALVATHAANDGLPFAQTLMLAKQLGLRPMPPMTPTPDTLSSMLSWTGPLWFAGLFPSGHVVVITGITSTGIYINDPWPPTVGARRTLAFDKFGSIIQPLHAGPANTWEAFKLLFSRTPADDLTPNILYLPDSP